MNRKRVCIIVCTLWIFLLVLPASCVFAAETDVQKDGLQTEAEASAGRGDTWQVTVRFHDLPKEKIAAFRLRVAYDERYLTLEKISPGDGAPSGSFDSYLQSAGAAAVYASPERFVSGKDGVCCVCRFSVQEDAPAGSTRITVTADQLADDKKEKLSGTCSTAKTLEIQRRFSSRALLQSLKPSAGELVPAFSPEITEYTLDVPYDVTQLQFDAEAKDNGTVRVNRKNLKKPGEPTVFILTVTSEDGKEKTEYIVTATRGAKPEGDTSEDASGNGKTGAKTSSKASSGKTSSKKSTSAGKFSGTLAEDGSGRAVVYGDRIIQYNSGGFLPFLLGALMLCVLLLAGAVLLLVYQLQKGKREKKNK